MKNTPYIRTPEIREKIRRSLLGNVPWNKGKKRPPFSEEWLEKMRISHLGNKSHTGEVHSKAYKNRMSRSCKGIKKYEGFGDKVSKSLKGYKKTAEHLRKIGLAQTGEKSQHWKGGGWGYTKVKILIRDNWTCQTCGLYDKEVMTVDHKISRKIRPDLEYHYDNLWVLCANCHMRKTRNDFKLIVQHKLSKQHGKTRTHKISNYYKK